MSQKIYDRGSVTVLSENCMQRITLLYSNNYQKCDVAVKLKCDIAIAMVQEGMSVVLYEGFYQNLSYPTYNFTK